MVTKLDLNGTLIAFTDLGAAPTSPSFGGGIYLNGGIFYQRLASGVIGTLTNAGGTPGTVSSVTVLAPLPGLSVAGNNITTEGTIIITGTLTHGAGGTGLGATPTNGQVLIGNGAGYTLGTLTAGAGMGITNSAGGISIASTEWTSTGTLTHLVTSTRNVTVGDATDIAKFGVIGDTDEVQARIRANATQSNYLALFEDSAGNAQVAIGGNGDFISNEEGNDADFRVEGNTNTHLIFGDAGLDAVGINAPTIDASAKFQIDSTTSGLLPPRMTTAQRTGIGTPADGLVVYDTDLDALYLRANGAWVALASSAGSTPLFYREGLILSALTVAIVEVGVGEITVESTIVSKTAATYLNMATAGDWIGGSSLESASEYAQVYANAAGDLKLYDKMPNYPRANTASRVADARVNQAGWVGTAGNGLNATSIVYDTDTGEGSIVAGMLLGIYSDATFETGRGRGSGAAASVNNASFALITAVNTGTNTLTVAAGHNIAINDNDYLIVIEYGSLEYISVSSVWWRLVGRIFNNSGSDLDADRLTHRAVSNVTGTDYTTTSTSLVDINTANFTRSILISNGDISAHFQGGFLMSAAQNMFLNITIDAISQGNTDGLVLMQGAGSPFLTFTAAMLPGTHDVAAQWKVSGGTATLYSSAVALKIHFVVEQTEK